MSKNVTATSSKRLQSLRTEMSLQQLSEEMREFKSEMLDFKAEAERDRKAMHKAWGDLANKLGTIIEDIVAPNILWIAVEDFGFSTIDDFLIRPQRRSRRGADRRVEFDVVCTGPERIIVAEAKSTATESGVERFGERVKDFFDFYPEYEGRELVKVFASSSFSPGVCELVSSKGFFGMAMGEGTMQIVVSPKPG